MQRAGLELVEDRVTDALRVASQMRIPEPQRFDAARFQKLFPFLVVSPLVGKTVLASVQFNIQLRLFAKEIQIVITDRMLASELVMAETSVAQPAPHQFFRPGFFFAKLAGALDVGHDREGKRPGGKMKFVFSLAPVPRPSDGRGWSKTG